MAAGDQPPRELERARARGALGCGGMTVDVEDAHSVRSSAPNFRRSGMATHPREPRGGHTHSSANIVKARGSTTGAARLTRGGTVKLGRVRLPAGGEAATEPA